MNNRELCFWSTLIVGACFIVMGVLFVASPDHLPLALIYMAVGGFWWGIATTCASEEQDEKEQARKKE